MSVLSRRCAHAVIVAMAFGTVCEAASAQEASGEDASTELPAVKVEAPAKPKKRKAAKTGAATSANPAPSAAVAADGPAPSDSTGFGGAPSLAEAPYVTPGSSSYISASDFNRLGATSVGDIFKTAPGVFAGDNRNGVSVDVNIRGMQSMNRNAVLVDGTRQTTSMYTGYRGNQDRLYVDPDLLSGIFIDKGPSGGLYGAGVIGGVVNMTTLEAGDIVRPGQTFGARVKGSLMSGTIDPEPREIIRDFFEVPNFNTGELRTDRPGLFNGASYSGSFATGYTNNNFEFVAAASRRVQGNYFAGKKGKTNYTHKNTAGVNDVFQTEVRPLSPIKPGEEVTNTSQDSFSALAKAKVKLGDGHSFNVGYTYYDNEYGEAGDIMLIYGLLSEREPSTVTTKTFNFGYTWNPADNPLIDFRANAWTNRSTNDSPNIMDVPLPTQPVPGVPQPNTLIQVKSFGGDMTNTSRLGVLRGLTVTYGAEYYSEELSVDVDVAGPLAGFFMANDINGTRDVGGLFLKADLKITDWLTAFGSARYDMYRAEDNRGPENITNGQPWPFPSETESGFSPTAGLMIEPFNGVQLYGMYEQGWRPPSLRELMMLHDWNGFEHYETMAPLDAEVAKNVEFGINYAAKDVATSGDELFLKLAYFNNETENYIARLDGAYSYDFFNVESVTFKGIELSGKYDAGFVFGAASLSYYTDHKFCMPDSAAAGPTVCNKIFRGRDFGAPFIPPEWSGSLTLGTRLFNETLTLGSRLTFAGEKLAVVRHNYQYDTQWKPYAVLDLFASYKVTDDATLDFSVENVGDLYYVDALSRAQLPSPGRTVRTSFTARF